MKRFCVILILAIVGISSSFAQQFWRQLPMPTSKDLNRLCFLDSLTGWIVGDGGMIIKTTDGGQSWRWQNAGLTDDIIEIFMLDAAYGWALAHSFVGESAGTFILKTTNGGDDWEKRFYPQQYQYFFSLYFLDSLRGWMAGRSGKIVGTADGGSSWFDARIDTSSTHLYWDLFKVKFISPERAFAVGGRFDLTGVLWKTTNGGITWTNHTVGGEPLYDFVFLDSVNGMGVGGDFEFGANFIRTTDAGETWQYRWLGVFGQGRAISFRTSTEGWVPLGFSGAYMYTFDRGETWFSEFLPAGMTVYDVQFTDKKTGYMIGDSGVVLKYNYYAQDIEVSPRWNIVSLPLTVLYPQKDFLFPSSVSHAFAFTESGYQPMDALENGKGYWLKFPAALSFELEGIPRTTDTLTVRKGWNLIGSISYPVAVTSLFSEPPNILASSFFGYDGGYVLSDTIFPGKGYWVKVHENGKLILHADAAETHSLQKNKLLLPKK
jgi:photosystem II stability/assembly factor-like uncharacterized protein